MRLRHLLTRVAISFVVVYTFVVSTRAQEPRNPTQNPDVVRVTTSLVQTDVMVFDKQGKFVDNLKREQFSLKVDGKPRDIAFFELVKTGNRNEEAQLAAARGNPVTPTTRAIPLDRGRTVFFFIDDIHLSPGSMKSARDLLARFIDRQMSQNDEVAITSASGQIGFLQQLTDNKTVLHKALERLTPRTVTARDTEHPSMSEYQAELIENGNQDVLGYYVDILVRNGIPAETAERMVQARAASIVAQSNNLTRASLATLQSLVRSSSEVAGRKLLVLISDGFYIHHSSSDTSQRLRELTSEAAKTGVVIYSIDARGLTTGSEDITSAGHFDPSGRLARGGAGEIAASQDGLNTLAVDTGGRALFNKNDLAESLTTALKETSTYYLLAWRPQGDRGKNEKFSRLEVSILGRPEYTVRFRRFFGEADKGSSAAVAKAPAQSDSDLVRNALRSPFPRTDLPVYLTLNFLNLAGRGTTLTSSMRVATDSLKLEVVNGKPSAKINIAGMVFDEKGNTVASFSKTVSMRATATTADEPPASVSYNELTTVMPGLYQVRVVAVDQKQRLTGSAVEWIEIPDLHTKELALSSLIVAEKPETERGEATPASDDDVRNIGLFIGSNLRVDRRFARTSRLRFLTIVYNAGVAAVSTSGGAANPTASSVLNAGAGAKPVPDLAVQVQVLRDDQPVITTPLQKLRTDGLLDTSSVPYAADVLLDELSSGRYLLRVTVIDRIKKASASRDYKFQVD